MSAPQRLGRRVGVIDIGSNSVRFVLFHVFGASFSPTYNEKILAGLGRDLRDTGRLSESGKADTLAALKRFRHLVEARRLSPVLIGATAALRDATDAAEFLEQVEAETGFQIEPISGESEARLAAAGVLAGDKRSEGLACDLGGASLELVEVASGKAGRGVSLNLGPFQVVGDDLLGDFDPEVQGPVIDAALARVDVDLGEERTLHLVGGAWRNLMTLHQKRVGYPLRVLQSYTLDAATARGVCEWAYGRGREEVLSASGVSSRRRETLPYGALVLERLILRFRPDRVRVSASGLREGLVVEHLRDLREARSPLHDACRDLARGNLQADGFARPLMDFLQPVSGGFPKAFGPEAESRLRIAACHMAGMGKGFHPDYRARLVFEEVLYAPLPGLLHAERAYLANIMHATYTWSHRTTEEETLDHLLTPHQRHCARVFGSAVRLAVAACGRAVELLPKLSLREGEKITLHAEPGFEDLVTPRVEKRLRILNARVAGEE